MKYTQRLDYGRLAEVLHERGLADIDAIRELLQLSQEGGMAFCEALVTSNLVADWDLSRVVCEVFQLPFLPVDLMTPNPAALEEIDNDFFRKHQLVPMDLFGEVMTVAMPGLVPAEVLAQASAMTDCSIIPIVGSVESNRRWCSEHLSAAPAPEMEGGWESMFDAADAGLSADPGAEAAADPLAALDDPPAALPTEAPGEEDALDFGSALEMDSDSLDLGEIEAMPADDLETEPLEGLDDLAGPTDLGDDGSSELPPMPNFGQDA